MKHLTILALVILVEASLFVLASRPAPRLETNTVTGGDGPAVQSLTGTEAQPVSIVNWLIDENGNIRVSNQVRERVIPLLSGPVTLSPDGTEWYSDFFEQAGRFNTIQVRVEPVSSRLYGASCRLDWRWSEGVIVSDEPLVDQESYPPAGFGQFPVKGPEARVVCRARYGAEGQVIDQIWVYLRAE